MSSGRKRPLESIKWDANMVLMRVDFPSPVWPVIHMSMLIHIEAQVDLPTHMTLNWKPRFSSFFSICCVMLSKPTWLLGKTAFPCGIAVVMVDDISIAELCESNRCTGEASLIVRRWIDR
jgi:hypothetical protein